MIHDALATDENYILQLYNSAITPTNSTTAGTFSGHTATFTGYSASTLTRANWVTPTQVSTTAQTSYNTSISWTCGATGDTVYGYWVVGATSGICLWAELFGTARTLANGDILNLTPVIALDSATNP
jgi:hypothetical protein